jgi:hypothetical protein
MRPHNNPARSLILSCLLLAGCATKVSDSITVPMGELAMYDAVPKEKSIAKLEKHIEDAKSENMPILAPHYFREASDILEAAHGSSLNRVATDELAKADAILDKGEVVGAIVKKTFAKELELKALLEQSAANEYYPWGYRTVINELSNLIEKVELDSAGNMESIESDKEELNKSMRVLYNKAVEYSALQKIPLRDSATQTSDRKK